MAAVSSGSAKASAKVVRRALITGGNRGIGLDTARKLAIAGWEVILAGRSKPFVLDAIKTLEDATRTPIRVKPLVLDVADKDSVATSLAGIKLDCVINNAGIYEDGWDASLWERTMQTNTLGPIRVISACADGMAKDGLIVNVSSGYGADSECPSAKYLSRIAACKTYDDVAAFAESGFDPEEPSKAEYVPIYKLSKNALNRATKLYASDRALRSKGVATVACCPGWVRTRMGGSSASRSVDEGSASVVACVELHFEAIDSGAASPVNGKFMRDGKELRW